MQIHQNPLYLMDVRYCWIWKKYAGSIVCFCYIFPMFGSRESSTMQRVRIWSSKASISTISHDEEILDRQQIEYSPRGLSIWVILPEIIGLIRCDGLDVAELAEINNDTYWDKFMGSPLNRFALCVCCLFGLNHSFAQERGIINNAESKHVKFKSINLGDCQELSLIVPS